MPRTSKSKQKADANDFAIKRAQCHPTFRPLPPVTSPLSSMYFPSSLPLPLRIQAQALLILPPLLPLPKPTSFLQHQAQKAQRKSLPIASPDPTDLALLAAHLLAEEEEKEDFDPVSIDDAAEIKTNDAFLAYDLVFDDEKTDTNDKDWEDYFPDKAQRGKLLDSSEDLSGMDINDQTSKA
ncbi:hypothetical protein MMC31_003487 [Peltigera leucophlebia]|nr:hypothetical protein [Peltigera leucophlebia]